MLPTSPPPSRSARVLAWLAAGVVALVVVARAAENPQDLGLVDQFRLVYFTTLVWEKTTWLGVHSYQTPTDNWMMQEIMTEVEPDFVIETGTRNGGTALYYASILTLLGTDGRVITVDITPKVDEAEKRKIFRDRVQVVTGDSVAPAVVDPIRKQVEGKKVLVTLDSLHTKEHVLKEMERYGPMVSVGSYLVVQDTISNGHPALPDFGPGPQEAVDEFLKTHKEFEIDHSRERFLLTFYPNGFLKKVAPSPAAAPAAKP
jgi:cephalosporin hydroxylase